MLIHFNGVPLKLAEIQHNLENTPDHSPALIEEITARCVWAAGHMSLGEMSGSLSVDRIDYGNPEYNEPGHLPAKEHGLSTTLFGYRVLWFDEDEGTNAPIYRTQFGTLEVWL